MDADRKARIARKDKKRNRALKRAHVEHVDLWVVFVRDCGICQICGEPITELTGKMRPSRDHVLPVARKGLHNYANVQLAHLSCNSRKGGRLAGRGRALK